jgi:hypothetical protein
MSNMQTVHIELVTRTEHDRKTETISFRCLMETREKLTDLQLYYKTDKTDVLEQLIELAWKGIPK